MVSAEAAAARCAGMRSGRGYTAATVDGGARGSLGSLRLMHAPTSGPPASDLDADVALLAGLLARDAAALEQVYDRYSQQVYALALHLLRDRGSAEDIVQETFVKLWRRPAAYQPARGRLLSWLLGVAHHDSIDLLRRRQLEQRHSVPVSSRDSARSDAVEAIASPAENGPADEAGAAERRRAVTGALARLPAAQRIPLELAYYQGLTQVEIADLLREPLGTVKTRMRLGLQRLRLVPGLVREWDTR